MGYAARRDLRPDFVQEMRPTVSESEKMGEAYPKMQEATPSELQIAILFCNLQLYLVFMTQDTLGTSCNDCRFF
jgi:hypothetical protein